MTTALQKRTDDLLRRCDEEAAFLERQVAERVAKLVDAVKTLSSKIDALKARTEGLK
ncbi:MAG: hypothetical protein ACJ8AW_31420 [Rhodopila sp.]